MNGRRDHSISRWLAALALATWLLPGVCWSSPPKATAPIDLRAAVLDAVRAGEPLRLRLTAVPRVDAPLLKLAWLLPAGVLLEPGESSSWSGAARASTTAELTITVRLANLEPRTIIAGATIERADGARQVKAVSLELPPGAAAKAPAELPVTRNSRGEPVTDHVVQPGPTTGR